eukprot:scaffold226942_cov18-Prasinocladus_malaysianus.AAC.1
MADSIRIFRRQAETLLLLKSLDVELPHIWARDAMPGDGPSVGLAIDRPRSYGSRQVESILVRPSTDDGRRRHYRTRSDFGYGRIQPTALKGLGITWQRHKAASTEARKPHILVATDT